MLDKFLDKIGFGNKPPAMPVKAPEPPQVKPKPDTKPFEYNPYSPVSTMAAGAIRRGMDVLRPTESKGREAFDANLQFAKDNFTAFDSGLSTQASLPQVPTMLANWYASQSFIGWQACATIAQHWLVWKACVIPGEDAVRKGWDITLNDGEDLDPDVLDRIRKRDTDMRLVANLIDYVAFSRVFGIRIMMFLVDSEDPKYYEKPFNPDGIKRGSYRGMSQVDPYWLAPELDTASASQPQSLHFYEPTWWIMSGRRVHRTHLCVVIPNPVADVLKPTYYFGGVPLTQQIYERVYNAERCSTEAAQLMATKRMNVLRGDLDLMLSNQAELQQRLGFTSALRDNYGIKVIGQEETYEQHDTGLTDVDTTVLTQYQLVAAIANIPPTKLIGEAPAGSLGQTGDYEEAVYHEMVSGIQNNQLTEVLKRHYLLLCKSEFPGLADANLVPVWKELDAMTEQERADVNLKIAQADQIWGNLGALNGQVIADRLMKDKNSGYSGITLEAEEPVDMGEEPESEDDGTPPQSE